MAQWLEYLLLDPAARGLIPIYPIFSEEKIINIAEVNQPLWLEESGQRVENVDWTHLELASGKPVLQNFITFNTTKVLLDLTINYKSAPILMQHWALVSIWSMFTLRLDFLLKPDITTGSSAKVSYFWVLQTILSLIPYDLLPEEKNNLEIFKNWAWVLWLTTLTARPWLLCGIFFIFD